MIYTKWSKVIDDIGIPVELEDYRACYNIIDDRNYKEEEEWEKKVVEFETKLLQIGKDVPDEKSESEMEKLVNQIKRLIVQYSDIFDKNYYVLNINRLLFEEIGKNDSLVHREQAGPEIFGNSQLPIARLADNNVAVKGKIIKKNLTLGISKIPASLDSKSDRMENSKYYLEKIDYSINSAHASPEYKEELNRIMDNNTSIFKELSKYIGLNEISKYLQLEDLQYIGIDRYAGDYCYIRAKKIINENLEYGENDKILSDFILENCGYIDPVKYLLLSNENYYSYIINNIDDSSFDALNELKLRISILENMVENEDMQMVSSRYVDEEGNKIPISLKSLKRKVEELERHFINKRYCENLEEERGKYIGQIEGYDIWELNVSDIKKLNFSKEEMSELFSKEPEIIDYFLTANVINLDELSDILEVSRSISYEETRILLEHGFMDEENAISLYIKGKIDFSVLEELQNEPMENISFENAVNEGKLVQLYFDKNKRDEFIKYRNAFKLFKLKDKTLEEKMDVAYSILDQNIELNDTDKLFDLYNMGLMPIQMIIELHGDMEIKQLIVEKKLKAGDIRELLNNGTLSNEMIEEIMIDERVSKEVKTFLMIDLYPTSSEEDETRRKYLRELSELDKAQRGSIYDRTGEAREEDGFYERNTKIKNITDMAYRYQFLTFFDDNTTLEIFDDGNVKLFLPDRGEYIIEKMLTEDDGYGQATYFFSEDVYEKNKDRIVQNKAINVSACKRIHQENPQNTLRVIHTIDIEKWAERICEHMGVEIDEQLRNIIDNIVNSRRRIEDEREDRNNDGNIDNNATGSYDEAGGNAIEDDPIPGY